MPRSRRLVPLLGLAAALAIGPILAGVALAADPVVVRPGDTLTAISRRHGISIADLVEINDLPDPNRIYAGQRLRVREKAKPPAAPAPASDRERTHRVRPGEHLTGIARRYGVGIPAIVAANGIADPSRIFVGQRLTIPGSAEPAPAPASNATPPSSPPPAAERTHRVRPGEHLTGIARRYGVGIAAIVAANRIADPSRIFVGQQLRIPGSAPRAGGAGPAMPASMRQLMDRRDGVRRMIVEEAARFEVPAALALAVAWQESGWRQNVVSHAGAVGVMQLLPATGEWVGATMLDAPVDLRNTRHNVRAGVRLLAHYLERYGGNVDLVLAAYYQGQTAADRHGVYRVSRPYVASIRALMRLLGG